MPLSPFAWHRLVLLISDKWSPFKLEGDAAKGYAEFVDLHRPRLAVRWRTLRRDPSDPAALLRSILKAEAGQLATDAARPPEVLPAGASHALVHEDTEPYKRDVAVVYFPAARRLVQLSYPLRRRETVLQSELLPNLTVLPDTAPAPWSVFGLRCLTPPGLHLERHRLNAGDLSLTFTGDRRFGVARTWACVRELAAPELALTRSTMTGWLRSMQRPDERFYKPAPTPPKDSPAPPADVPDLTVAGHDYPAARLLMPRRRRYAWLPLPRACVTLGCHDTRRDRLVLLHGTDETLLRQLAGTMGVGLEVTPSAQSPIAHAPTRQPSNLPRIAT